MKYNFDKIIDRSKTEAAKYHKTKEIFGTDDILPLWIADMDLQVPQPVVEAIKARADHAIFGYNSLTSEYKEAVISWQKRRHDWDLEADLLGTSPGVVPALVPLIENFSQEGDEILIQPPVYHQFANVIKQCKRKVLNNPLKEKDGEYSIDFEDLEEKLKTRPKLFILCHPHNPIGRVFSREELEKIGNLCLTYQVPLISDEIHSDLMLWGKEHTPMAKISEEIAANTITCFSIGKTFNMAGLQFSSIYFNNMENKAAFDAYWDRVHLSMPNTFAQAGAIAAYNEGEDWLDQALEYIQNNMTYVQAYLEKEMPKIKVRIPDATFLMWLDFRDLGMTGPNLGKFLLEKAKLGLNPGASFGEEYQCFARLNVATARGNLEQALGQLKAAYDQL